MWPEFFHFLRKVICTPFKNSHFYSRGLYLRHFIQSRWASSESHMTKLVYDQAVVQATSLLQFYFFHTQRVSQPVWKSVLDVISSKMTSIRGRGILLPLPPSLPLTLFHLPNLVTNCLTSLLDLWRRNPPLLTPLLLLDVPKYSKDDLQRILKAGLEAWAPTPLPVPALV